MLVIAILLGALALLAWLGLLLHPARPWDCHPRASEGELGEHVDDWPSVAVIVPARNEASQLPATLPALLCQDYPGPLRVIVVDDLSTDETADTARRLATEADSPHELSVVEGSPRPPGWVGKVWAMEQGRQSLAEEPTPRYFLLTDADIRHAPGSLRRLVSEAEESGHDLVSRMALLSCENSAERWLIPAFVWFFALLYPFRRVNDPRSPVAAAAGGCVLVRTSALERAGGFETIRDRIIDDVSLARAIKDAGGALHLSLSTGEVKSLRRYSVGEAWSMVRRTAFTELRTSWLRLAACLALLALLFGWPPLLTVLGLAQLVTTPSATAWAAVILGGFAWSLPALLHVPALRLFGLRAWRAWALPVIAGLYGAMTLDSALRHARRAPTEWRASAT